jgi:hypothetical protein
LKENARIVGKGAKGRVDLGGLTPEDLINSRQNPKAYYLLFDHLLETVVSKRAWQSRLEKQLLSMNELCTTSDEAFALLVIENCWDNWLDTFVLHGGDFIQQKRKRKGEESTEDEIRSSKMFKYTTVSDNNKNYNKWTPRGVQRFNELYRHVKSKRERYRAVDRMWLDKNHNTGYRSKQIEDEDYEAALNDLVPV